LNWERLEENEVKPGGKKEKEGVFKRTLIKEV
jgi:hypothetical protein